MLMIRQGTVADDHIAAVAWFLVLACEAEEFGLNWADILRVVTPEESDALRTRIQNAYKGNLRLKL